MLFSKNESKKGKATKFFKKQNAKSKANKNLLKAKQNNEKFAFCILLCPSLNLAYICNSPSVDTKMGANDRNVFNEKLYATYRTYEEHIQKIQHPYKKFCKDGNHLNPLNIFNNLPANSLGYFLTLFHDFTRWIEHIN